MVVLQVSQIGQFEAEMSSDSFQLLGMAERGFLPACLARRSRYETPTLAIVLSSVGICALSMFDFRQVQLHPSCATAISNEDLEAMHTSTYMQESGNLLLAAL